MSGLIFNCTPHFIWLAKIDQVCAREIRLFDLFRERLLFHNIHLETQIRNNLKINESTHE